MKSRDYLLIILLIVIVIGIYFYVQRPVLVEPSCNWKPDGCDNICQSQNYYFDLDFKECRKYVELGVNKGCCTSPPFETLEECKSICE